MKNIIKTQKGITLIALVITIVVMLILAGISINLIIGENGIFTKTKEAREKFEVASVKEQIGQDLLSADMYLSKNNNKFTNGQLAATLEKYGTVVYGTGENINKVEGVTIQDGTTINISDIWSGTQDVSWDINGENKKVTPVLDTEGIAVPVPMGFYYVGGKVDTGVVISDNSADENDYRDYSKINNGDVPSGYSYENDTDEDETTPAYLLEGNQFVWIPVTGGIENARKFPSENLINYTDVLESNYLTTTTTIRGAELSHEEPATIALYREMQTSVNNYEGFYVARYEASSSDGTENGTVVSKANSKPWNKIKQPDALAKSVSMYSGSVKSLLMSSYTWGATLNFIQNSGNKKDVSFNSISWGNYSGRKSSIEFFGYFRTTEVWETGAGPLIENTSNLILATGISESTKANNIYDIAGNEWEMTTEICDADVAVARNKVIRGGGYNTNYGAIVRGYDVSDGRQLNNIGFRSHLFIQM